MKLIIGLGNPGKQYASTRHNIGKDIVESFGGKYDFPAFEFEKKLRAFVSKKGDAILALPETFMNNSGEAAKLLINYYKINPNDLAVVHDDFDLETGKIKISKNISSAGHKGIESIIQHTGTKDFARIRIGIKPKAKQVNLEKFVLKKFSLIERFGVQKIIAKATEIIAFLLENGLEKTMNEFNRE